MARETRYSGTFLLAIYNAASGESAGDRLYKRSHSWHFIQKWTPAHTLAADFGSVVCYREYTMKGDGPRSSRPDFVIVDPANKFVIVLEIKAGAAFGQNQLAEYLTAANKVLVNRAAFKSYQKAFVALDPDLDSSRLPANFDIRWIGMDYSWLSKVERAAEGAVLRGDRGGELMQSLCRTLTEYETPSDQRLGQLAAELAIHHPAVVTALKTASKNARILENWSKRLVEGEGPAHQLFRLYVQHQRALDRLVGLSPLRLLLSKLSDAYPLLEAHPELSEAGKVWFVRAMPLEPERQPPLQAGGWPLLLRIRHLNRRDSGKEPQFRISLHWWSNDVRPGGAMARAAEILGDHFGKPGIAKIRVNWLTLHEERCTGVKNATTQACVLIERVQRISRAVTST